jgi:hypothetical protein
MYNRLEEITDWGDYNVPNYIYYTTERNTRLHGYQKEEGGKFYPFNTFIFSTKGRKFKSTKVKELPIKRET